MKCVCRGSVAGLFHLSVALTYRLTNGANLKSSAELLFLVAREAFAARGFGTASSREICAQAGLNPSAIHKHYGSVDQLEVDVAERLLLARVAMAKPAFRR